MSVLEELHQAHKTRLAKIAARARGATTYTAPPPVEPPKPAPDLMQWVMRQKEVWFSIESEVNQPTPPVNDIIRAVCRHFSISKTDLLSARRTRPIVRPRQIGYYLTKKLTRNTLPEIGRRFGGRDHTSCLSGIRKIEALRKSDVNLDADVKAIAAALGASL